MPAARVHVRPLIILLALSLAMFIPQASASGVVRGSVYEWSTSVDVLAAQPSGPGLLLLLGAALLVLIIGAGVFLLLRKKKLPVKPEVPPGQAPPAPAEPAMLTTTPSEALEQTREALEQTMPEDTVLPDDLREVVRIIEKNGGRITQLELRKALPYSEAKVSLMVSDLESRGIVKKIKKGRGNIIILYKQDGK